MENFLSFLKLMYLFLVSLCYIFTFSHLADTFIQLLLLLFAFRVLHLFYVFYLFVFLLYIHFINVLPFISVFIYYSSLF